MARCISSMLWARVLCLLWLLLHVGPGYCACRRLQGCEVWLGLEFGTRREGLNIFMDTIQERGIGMLEECIPEGGLGGACV